MGSSNKTFLFKGFWMKSAPVRWLPRLDRLTYSTYRGWTWSKYTFAMSIEQWKKHLVAFSGHRGMKSYSHHIKIHKVYTKGSSKLCLGWFLKTCQFQHSLRFNYWHPLEGSRWVGVKSFWDTLGEPLERSRFLGSDVPRPPCDPKVLRFQKVTSPFQLSRSSGV